MKTPEDFFDLSRTRHKALYEGLESVWEAVPRIGEYIKSRLTPGLFGIVKPGARVGGDVYIGPGTVIEAGATVRGPAIFGHDCQIRSGAYIRENVILGDGCIVGNSSEVKQSVFHDGAVAPHFAYVGDSLLGFRAHLGAGAKLSNVRFDGNEIVVSTGDDRYNTKLLKLGAVLGDEAEIGCNSVLNPGSLIGPRSVLYPCVVWSGTLGADRTVELRQQQLIVEHGGRA